MNVRFTASNHFEKESAGEDLAKRDRVLISDRHRSPTYENEQPTHAEIHRAKEPNLVEESQNDSSHHRHLTVI